jgi:SAM-dependent methyltransferase
MYDTIGAVQFAFLSAFFGLRETHKLLEIGSGSLRAARFLIPYLNSGHYCGVEPAIDAVRLGIENELGPEIVERKKPRFTARTDFDFREFGERFDFALSYSVFTHVPPTQVGSIFVNAADVFHDGSILLATACCTHEAAEQIVDADKWTSLPVNIYSFDRLEHAAAAAGLRMLFLGHAFQDWFVAFKDGNQAAIRGAEQIARVDWPAVLPPWQDPGWKVSPWKLGK